MMSYLSYIKTGFLLLVGILFVACGSIKPKGITRTNAPDWIATSPMLSPLGTGFQKALFKASMDVKDHHLTGLFLIKKMKDSIANQEVTRFFFSNEFGMTYFDLGIYPDSMQINYCFEPMNKKGLLSLLETSFRLLTTESNMEETTQWYMQKDPPGYVLRNRKDGLLFWTMYNEQPGQITGRNGKTNFIDKILISIERGKDNSNQSIHINNPLIGLKLSLRKLN
jgi:hypothetical protein